MQLTQTNGTSAKHSHALTRLETRELQSMPSSWEDVCQQSKIRLMLGPWRQLQAIEVCKWHAEVLGLTTLVRSHCHVTVGSSSETRVDTCTERGFAYHKEKGQPCSD